MDWSVATFVGSVLYLGVGLAIFKNMTLFRCP